MQTKLYEVDLLIFKGWSEKSELIARFMLKQHGFFALADIDKVNETEFFM